MNGVGTFIIERPRPLSSDRRADYAQSIRSAGYTLNYEEPAKPAIGARNPALSPTVVQQTHRHNPNGFTGLLKRRIVWFWGRGLCHRRHWPCS